MNEKINVFKCENCGYEDSSIIPSFYKEGEEVDCPICKADVKVNFFESEHGEYMTFREYAELVKFIFENHGWRDFCKKNSKKIKYVDCSFDTRIGKIGYVKLDDSIFAIRNENRHRNLKEWIYAWLSQ